MKDLLWKGSEYWILLDKFEIFHTATSPYRFNYLHFIKSTNIICDDEDSDKLLIWSSKCQFAIGMKWKLYISHVVFDLKFFK